MILWILYILAALSLKQLHTIFRDATNFLQLVQLLRIDPRISQLNETALKNIPPYGYSEKSKSKNSNILQSAIKYIFATKQFDENLFWGHTNMLDLYYIFFTLAIFWRHVICGAQVRSTNPKLIYCKCLNINWLEVEDITCILFVLCYLHCHIWSNNRPYFVLSVFTTILFYFL